MKSDVLQQFTHLRTSLINERKALVDRLARIEEALGSGPAIALATPVSRVGRPRAQKQRPARQQNKLSLKEAIVKVTSAKPLTRPEILEAVIKLGYKFSTKNPAGSLNACLYKKADFVRRNGRFAPRKSVKD